MLIPNFRRTFPRLWSVRLGIIAGLFSGAEVVLPLLDTALPKGLFAALSFVAAVGGVIARAIQQKALHGDD